GPAPAKRAAALGHGGDAGRPRRRGRGSVGALAGRARSGGRRHADAAACRAPGHGRVPRHQLRPAGAPPWRGRVGRPDPGRTLGHLRAIVQPAAARAGAGTRQRRHHAGSNPMSAHDTNPAHFNRTARSLHWLMAVLIIAMLFIGVGMVSSVSARPWLIDLHRPMGIAILLLAVLRLRNRMRHHPPALPASLPVWQRRAAHASHWLLYGLMVALPVIGWAMLSAAGDPVRMASGLVLPPIAPQDPLVYAAL